MVNIGVVLTLIPLSIGVDAACLIIVVWRRAGKQFWRPLVVKYRMRRAVFTAR